MKVSAVWRSGQFSMKTQMKTTRVPFGPWKEAYRLEVGGTELIAVGEIGPRIFSLRLPGQPNILFKASEDSFVRGDWRIWGGHRFWGSPETESTYEPDNQAGMVKVENDKLVLTGAAEKSGLQKTLEIGATVVLPLRVSCIPPQTP